MPIYVFTFNSFANLFWSDPRYMSSYFEAQFRPRAARSNEVILLIPNLLNPAETLPVPVTHETLFNIYMDIYSRTFPEDHDEDVNPSASNIPVEWYVFITDILVKLELSTKICFHESICRNVQLVFCLKVVVTGTHCFHYDS